MCKKNKKIYKKNKKKWAIGLGIFITLGILVGVLVPVLSKKNDKKENKDLVLLNQLINTTNEKNIINIVQNLYKLKNKKEAEINNLADGDIKTKYISALALAKKIFIIKNDYKISLLEGKEKNSNLKEILLIATPKNIKRTINAKLVWPLNHIDQTNDKITILITFLEDNVVKVKSKLENKESNIEIHNNVFFNLKNYNLINLFYKFKLAQPSANNFKTYNAYLDDAQNTKGVAIFKNYLLTLKEDDSNVQIEDLKDVVKFTKGKINNSNKTISAILSFSYQGLTTTKVINDFTYKKAYQLSIKPSAKNKMSDEVLKADINLPEGAAIKSIASSSIKTDGSTVKLTFTSGNIKEQELGGFVTYEQKAQTLLTSTTNNDFSISNKGNIFPSEFKDKQLILDQLKAKASSLSSLSKTKVENILEGATITFNPSDQTNELRFQIVIGNISKNFTITGLNGINTINQKIDVEVAKKTMPTIKNASKLKSASQVQNIDIEITPSDNSLISKVINVSEKTMGISESDQGTIVIVTIEVSSSVVGTKILTYNVELSGLVSYEQKAQELLQNATSSDFSVNNKKNIWPSAFNNKQLILNQLKAKASSLSETTKTKVENIIQNALITLHPNNQIGELRFEIVIDNVSKTFIITGFKGIDKFNQKIDAEVANEKMPTIKNDYVWKTASQVQKEDIEIAPNDSSLITTVTDVSEKTGLPANNQGTIVIVTIKVSSSEAGTKTSTYDVEISGFVPTISSSDFKKLFINWLNIENKEDILPSQFNDINLIKNTLKSDASKRNSGTFANLILLQNAIDNNLKIILNANDQNGKVEIIFKLGYDEKKYIIFGFNSIDQKIDDEVAQKTAPTIKDTSKWKSASQAQNIDIEITSSDNNLISEVVGVSEKIDDLSEDVEETKNIEGTIVIVTIKVSSSVTGTKTSTYDVELSGFVSNRNSIDFHNLNNENLSNNKTSFIIDNKANILPSAFNNINLIKNTLKSKVDRTKDNYWNANALKNVIDNNLKVTFKPNDQTGTLEITLELGNNFKTYIITGFKTNGS